jgi:hypothetical protein
MGSYSKELTVLSESESWLYDQMMYRLVIPVLTGRTVKQDGQVSVQVPATWVDALKLRVRASRFDRWLAKQHLPRRLYCCWDEWTSVNYETKTASFALSQDITYPYANYTPPPSGQFGAPVIYEILELSGDTSFHTTTNAQRYMSWHEVASEYLRSPQAASDYGSTLGGGIGIYPFGQWLLDHGVNPDQLVRRG